ncbi:MAG: hypothetical protein JWP34_4471 [Massilia sp.]|nr:hypothetical protein [Massilia sp.]
MARARTTVSEKAGNDSGHETGPAGTDMEIRAGRRAPFTQVADWVALSGITARAQALYLHLAMHVNQAADDDLVWPSRQTLAVRLKFGQAKTVDRYLRELAAIGAVDITTGRIANGMRARNTYTVHATPPPGYTGPRSMADAYARDRADRPDQDARTDVLAGRSVIRKREQRESANANNRSPQTRTPVGRKHGPRMTANADGNQTKENETKENETKSPPPQPPAPTDEGPAVELLNALPAPWAVGPATMAQALPLVADALGKGWTSRTLTRHLTDAPEGVRFHQAVLLKRLTDLPPPRSSVPRPAAEPVEQCPTHPGAARRGGVECSACWTDRMELQREEVA